MKIANYHINHRKKIIVAVLAAMLLAVAFIAWYMYHFQIGMFYPKKNAEESSSTTAPPNTVNYQTPSDKELAAGREIKERVASTSNSDDHTDQHQTNAEISISSAQVTDGTLYIRTIISLVTNNGTCQLSLIGPNDKTYSATSSVRAMATSSTCQGFNIPLSSLEKGIWSATVTYLNNDAKISTNKQVTIP